MAVSIKFSLILPTVDRVIELERFLSSLDRQTCRDFELIVVDQNPDDRLAPILAPYQASFLIVHLRATRGLSRARNVGLAHIRGQIVVFPDDDCWYSPDLLETIARFFSSHPETAALCGRCVNGRGVPRGWWDSVAGPVTKMTVFKRSGGPSMFLTRRAVERIGAFDETLGLGQPTPWKGGEDIDYITRAVSSGLPVYYRPGLDVFHDDPPPPDRRQVQRAHGASCATGRLLRIHNFPLWYVAYWSAGSLALVLASTMKLDLIGAQYHWVSFLGRLEGWLAPPRLVSSTPVVAK
jgi:glycosyltransferase involved in cell wall biosynthesis